MKLTVHFEGETKEELLAELAGAIRLIGGNGKRTKAAPVDEDEDLDTEEESEEETEVEETEEESDDDEIEAGEDDAPTVKSKKGSKGPSLDDVIKAFQKYAKKNGRGAAKKVLTKYKVESVQDLDEAHYAKVLKLIAA